MAMYRREGRPDFEAGQAALLSGLYGWLAEGIQRAILLAAVPKGGDGRRPRPVLLSEGGAVETMNAAAKRWLEQLITTTPAPGQVPNVVSAVAYRALLAAWGGGAAAARARVPTTEGRWLLVHSSVLGDPGEGLTAVILEPARPPEMAPLIAEAYGLTARERDVTQLVIQGRSTEEIAAALYLSPYTVQDHLKSIFDKVGVRSRRELVGQVFFQHFVPRFGEPLGTQGWFPGGART